MDLFLWLLTKFLFFIFYFGFYIFPALVVLVLLFLWVMSLLTNDKFRDRMESLIRQASEGKFIDIEDRATAFIPSESEEEPTTPIIVIGRRGELDATILTTTGERKAYLRFLLEDAGTYFRYYAADGRLWMEEFTFAVPRRPWLAKLLARTIYNPVVPCHVAWRCERMYNLRELRRMLYLCIDEGADLFAQFIPAEKTKRRLRAAKNFKKILAVLDHTGGIPGNIHQPTSKTKAE